MGRVIYLTGAPASGKSTLCSYLNQRAANLLVLSYSAQLQEHVRRRDGESVGGEELREKSSGLIARADIMAVDAALIAEVHHKRTTHDIIIDSHPVTKESYGFRVTPFTREQINALALDSIVCLYASPEILRERILKEPSGRPLPSLFEIGVHIQTQAAVATQYSIEVGCSCYLVNSGVDPDALVDTAWPVFKLTSR